MDRRYKNDGRASIARVSVRCDAVLDGSCYIVEAEQLTWDDARARCVQLGGHLAIVESESENQFIKDLTAGKVCHQC